MPLFQEIDLSTYTGGQIVAIEPGSAAAKAGLQAGDELLAINGRPVEDVIDVQFYAAEEEMTLTVRRGGELLTVKARRRYNQTLGLEFSHPTFDTDIRRCNNLCEFCFVLQMAPRFRRTLYIKDDDYRYSFLFGHYVTLTNLSEHDWWRIEAMHLSPLYVSVHVTDWEARRRYLRNKTAPDILEQIRWLGERGIQVHTQIVVTPQVNDGEWLEQSIADLARLWPTVQSVSVVPVGLTKQHKYQMRTHTREEAAVTLHYVESLQTKFLDEFGVRFVYPTDEWYLVTGRTVPELDAYDGQELHENGLGMVRHFLDEWEEVKKEIRDWRLENDDQSPISNLQSLTLATGALFAPILGETAVQFQNLTGAQLTVREIKNEKLGGTITTAGLLMGADVLEQLKASGVGDLVLLPRVMFDHPDRIALDDLSPQDIANQLGKPVILADTMGDVWDALIGASQVVYQPGTPAGNQIPLKLIPPNELNNNTHFS
jgi:putative radical SAM enzyme (TIGR03279 family)